MTNAAAQRSPVVVFANDGQGGTPASLWYPLPALSGTQHYLAGLIPNAIYVVATATANGTFSVSIRLGGSVGGSSANPLTADSAGTIRLTE